MYLKRLSDKVWLTRNARFTAAKRMKRSRIGSTASVALLSAFVIAINLLVFLPEVNNETNIRITLGTIILSTFVLVMSLLITLLRYEWRENNYHHCAIELEHLNQQIQIRLSELIANHGGQDDFESPVEDNEKFLESYTQIIKKYNLNHTMFDYRYGCLSDSELQFERYHKAYMKIRYYVFDVYLLYWLISFVSLVPTIYIVLTIVIKTLFVINRI